jgi:hypothetical protein
MASTWSSFVEPMALRTASGETAISFCSAVKVSLAQWTGM